MPLTTLFARLGHMSHFIPLELVDRGSDIQSNVVENLNKFTFKIRGNCIGTGLLYFHQK